MHENQTSTTRPPSPGVHRRTVGSSILFVACTTWACATLAATDAARPHALGNGRAGVARHLTPQELDGLARYHARSLDSPAAAQGERHGCAAHHTLRRFRSPSRRAAGCRPTPRPAPRGRRSCARDPLPVTVRTRRRSPTQCGTPPLLPSNGAPDLPANWPPQPPAQQAPRSAA